jgi:hypothetical protein
MAEFNNALRDEQDALAGRISEKILAEAGGDAIRLWALLGEALEPHLADGAEIDVGPLTVSLPVLVNLAVISYTDWLAHAIANSGTTIGHSLAEPGDVDLACIAERYGVTRSLAKAVISQMRRQEVLPLLGRVSADGRLMIDEAEFSDWNSHYVRA